MMTIDRRRTFLPRCRRGGPSVELSHHQADGGAKRFSIPRWSGLEQKGPLWRLAVLSPYRQVGKELLRRRSGAVNRLTRLVSAAGGE